MAKIFDAPFQTSERLPHAPLRKASWDPTFGNSEAVSAPANVMARAQHSVGGQPDSLRFGTYNIAGGNPRRNGNTADEISPYVAEQVTSGGVDVLALQEVKIFPE